MNESNLFKIQKEDNIDTAKNLLKKNKISAVIVVPENFGNQVPQTPTSIDVTYDPANSQSNSIILGFFNNFFTQTNFQIQNAKPIYSVNEVKTNTNNLTYFDFILIGLIGLALMNSSVQGVAIALADYRQNKILKRLTTTPLKSWKFIFGQVISRLVVNLIQISVILAIGVWFFNAHIFGSIPLIFVFALIGAILFQAIGFVIASYSKTTDAAQGMATAITIPMMFLAGVFFPIDSLPKWLYSIVQFLPLAPILRIIRGIGLENASPFVNPMNIIIVGVWIVAMLALAIYKFRHSDE
jgi:ABC-2 type transport system permease protein